VRWCGGTRWVRQARAGGGEVVWGCAQGETGAEFHHPRGGIPNTEGVTRRTRLFPNTRARMVTTFTLPQSGADTLLLRAHLHGQTVPTRRRDAVRAAVASGRCGDRLCAKSVGLARATVISNYDPCVHTFQRARTHADAQTHAHTHMQVHTRTNTHTCRHTHTQARTHTHMQTNNCTRHTHTHTHFHTLCKRIVSLHHM